jgi:hypothetical protein
MITIGSDDTVLETISFSPFSTDILENMCLIEVMCMLPLYTEQIKDFIKLPQQREQNQRPTKL